MQNFLFLQLFFQVFNVIGVIMKKSTCTLCFIFFYLFPCEVLTQTLRVETSPWPFSITPPPKWSRHAPSTGNSRVKFVSPRGTPSAECAVIVKEFPSLKGQSQSSLDMLNTQPIDSEMISKQMSAQFNNVHVYATSIASISGHPAQLINVEYSTGTPSGQVWSRGIHVTTVTVPGIVWTISCGGLGKSAQEAEESYMYWQSEIIPFRTKFIISQ